MRGIQLQQQARWACLLILLVTTSACAKWNSLLGASSATVVIPPDGALVKWTPPTQNSDNSALTDLANYEVYESTTPGNPTPTLIASVPVGTNQYLVTGLSSGMHYFTVKACDNAPTQNCSTLSTPEVSKNIP